MIFFLVCLSPMFHGPYAPAYSLSCGVAMAGIFELLFLLWHIKKSGFLFGLQGPITAIFHLSKGVKTLLKKMAPGVVGSGVYQINLFLDTFFVSFVGAGAISWLNYAHHVFQLPIGVIGVAIGTALLPVLSKHIKTGEIEQANTHLNRGLEVSLIMSVASCIGMAMLAQPIIATLFQHGVFTENDTYHTARALMIFAFGLPAYMSTKTFAPFFYARGDTTTPVKIAVIGVALNSILALTFSGIVGIGSFRMSMGYAGIALATTCSVWVNTFQYLFKLLKHPEFSFDKLFKARFFKIIESATIMAVVIHLLKMATDFIWPEPNLFEQIISLTFIIGISGIVYLGCLILTKAVPFKQIQSAIKQKLKGKI
jgi:putative peptidoglycan lipid II flippase